jgi:hypothetical protein
MSNGVIVCEFPDWPEPGKINAVDHRYLREDLALFQTLIIFSS